MLCSDLAYDYNSQSSCVLVGKLILLEKNVISVAVRVHSYGDPPLFRGLIAQATWAQIIPYSWQPSEHLWGSHYSKMR